MPIARCRRRLAWDTNQWPFPSGETVQFYIEVYDNDTISGPKKGVSQTLTLKVHSREEEHRNLEKLQAEIAAAMLDLLADHLDLAEQLRTWQEQADAGQPTPSREALQQARDQQRAATERAEQMMRQLEQAMQHVQRDPFSTYETFADMQALQRNMAHLQNALLPQLQQSLQSLTPQSPHAAQLQPPQRQLEEVVQELERLSSLADHIASGEKLKTLRSSVIKCSISKTGFSLPWIISPKILRVESCRQSSKRCSTPCSRSCRI